MRLTQIDSDFLKDTFYFLGDSQTDFASYYGVTSANNYSNVCCQMLNKLGYRLKPRVNAIGGYTTNQVLGMSDSVYLFDKPKYGCIYIGVNDPGSALTSTVASATLNTIGVTDGTTKKGDYIGQTITISGVTKTIIAYNNTTKVVTLDSNLGSIPSNGTSLTINAPSTLQTQLNIQALIKIYKYGVKGINVGTKSDISFWSQTMLPAECAEGTRVIVMRDTSTTGGLNAITTTQKAKIAGDYSSSAKVTVWECRTRQAGEKGWGRVAIDNTANFSDGVEKVFVITPNYLNFPSGGDNYNTITNTGTQNAGYALIRTACINACSAESSSKLVDLYDYMSKLIYSNGTATFEGKTIEKQFDQGDGAWHYIPNNQHHNTLGHQIVAYALYLAFINTIS